MLRPAMKFVATEESLVLNLVMTTIILILIDVKPTAQAR